MSYIFADWNSQKYCFIEIMILKYNVSLQMCIYYNMFSMEQGGVF